MNIFYYIDKYGNLTFNEKPFNEVDNIILSSLSYIDLEKYVSKNSSHKKTILIVKNEYYKDHPIKEKTILATKNGLKVLRYISETKRFQNLLLYNYCYIGDKEEQFSALTIELNSKLVYISFEGTDQLISGWREDFMMSYKFPVLSQRRAISYVNKHFILNNKKIILGGHSKGGNLALIAGMYAIYPIKKRIINIYNNDGPGLKTTELNSKQYFSIKSKLIHIIPNYSVFGLLLRNEKKYIIIKSTKKSIYAHDFTTWVVENDHFMRSTLSNFSKLIEKTGESWLNKYSNTTQREKFVTELFNIFDELNITSLTDIYENKTLIFDIIMKSTTIDKETKKMLKDFITIFMKNFKDTAIKDIEYFFENKK